MFKYWADAFFQSDIHKKKKIHLIQLLYNNHSRMLIQVHTKYQYKVSKRNKLLLQQQSKVPKIYTYLMYSYIVYAGYVIVSSST